MTSSRLSHLVLVIVASSFFASTICAEEMNVMPETAQLKLVSIAAQDPPPAAEILFAEASSVEGKDPQEAFRIVKANRNGLKRREYLVAAISENFRSFDICRVREIHFRNESLDIFFDLMRPHPSSSPLDPGPAVLYVLCDIRSVAASAKKIGIGFTSWRTEEYGAMKRLRDHVPERYEVSMDSVPIPRPRPTVPTTIPESTRRPIGNNKP